MTAPERRESGTLDACPICRCRNPLDLRYAVAAGCSHPWHAPALNPAALAALGVLGLEQVGWLCEKGHLHEQEDPFVAGGKGRPVYVAGEHSGRHNAEQGS